MEKDRPTPKVGNWLQNTLIIIAILILAAITVPEFSAYFPSSKNLKARDYLKEMVDAQNKYYRENTRYAESIEELIEKKYPNPKQKIRVHILLSPNRKDYTMEAYHLEGNRKHLTGVDGKIKETELDKKAQ